MCAAPLVRPQRRRLSVAVWMVRVAKGLECEGERSRALWWILVRERDEFGVRGAGGSLR